VLRPVEEGLLADPSRTAQPPFWIFRQSAAFFRIVLEFQTKAAPATPPKEAPRGPLKSASTDQSALGLRSSSEPPRGER